MKILWAIGALISTSVALVFLYFGIANSDLRLLLGGLCACLAVVQCITEIDRP